MKKLPTLKSILPKLLLIAVMLTGLCSTIMAQYEEIDNHIQRLDMQIAQAAEEKNYEAAAALQKDRDNWVAMRVAIEQQDVGAIFQLQEALNNPYQYHPGQGSTATTTESSDVKSPEFVNQVYSINAQGDFDKLEKVDGHRVTAGGGAYGFSAKVTSYKVIGNESPVRLSKEQQRFIVKTYSGIDPSDMFELVKFDIRGVKKDRYVDMHKRNRARYHSSSRQVSENRVAVSFKSLGNATYEIHLDEELEPGEYGFLYGEKVFAFGVDDKK